MCQWLVEIYVVSGDSSGLVWLCATTGHIDAGPSVFRTLVQIHSFDCQVYLVCASPF